ncbi:MAG TPA: LUD domain-containing protein [Thermomicrobiales bacterium]|nr:LUD domain-containing protein [Thermomicrobiales bacterium]
MVLTSPTDESLVAALLSEFTARAAPVGTIIERVADSASAAAFIAGIAPDGEATTVSTSGEVQVAAPALIKALERRGLTCWTPVNAVDARDAPLGLSLARLAVAETGSMLMAEPNLGDRAIGLVSLTQVILCPTASLAPSLVEAADVMRELAQRPNGSYATLVTGPSRTADIEMSLTVGVQGPGKVYALFVDDLR